MFESAFFFVCKVKVKTEEEEYISSKIIQSKE